MCCIFMFVFFSSLIGLDLFPYPLFYVPDRFNLSCVEVSFVQLLVELDRKGPILMVWGAFVHTSFN